VPEVIESDSSDNRITSPDKGPDATFCEVEAAEVVADRNPVADRTEAVEQAGDLTLRGYYPVAEARPPGRIELPDDIRDPRNVGAAGAGSLASDRKNEAMESLSFKDSVTGRSLAAADRTVVAIA
jgi:hypothetical protein